MPFCGERPAIIRPSRGLIVKPSRAVRSASPNRVPQGSRPCSRWASSSIRTTPGTPVARPLTTASRKGRAWPFVVHQHVGRRAGRRRLAAVIDAHLARRRVIMGHEGAAAEAGALRLDEAEHRLDRDCGIDRAAAAAQHVHPGLDRERIGGGYIILLAAAVARCSVASRSARTASRSRRARPAQAGKSNARMPSSLARRPAPEAAGLAKRGGTVHT